MVYRYHFMYLATLICAIAHLTASCPDIVSRSEWGARSPIRRIDSLWNTPAKVFIHHTVTGSCNSRSSCSSRVRQVQRHHMYNEYYDDIGYNFLIGGDGSVYEGRGWDTKGAQALGFNGESIGIAFIGDYSRNYVPMAMQYAAERLIQCGVWRNKIDDDYKVYGHRQARNTACPGNSLYNVIKRWREWSPEYIYNDYQCTSEGGTCQDVSSFCGGGRYISGRCPGSSDVKCCLPWWRYA